jgi:serine protease
MSAMNHRSLLPLVLVSTFLGACGGGGGGGPTGPASIGGTIDFQDAGSTPQFVPGTGTLDSAQVQGLAQPGARLSFRVQDGDALHALSFVAREALHVRARARGEGELALAAYDPVELRFGAFAPAAQHLSALEFDVQGAFDVVLRGQGTLQLQFTRSTSVPARGVRSAASVDAASALFAAYEEPAIESVPGQLIVATRAGSAASELLAERGLREKLRIPDGPLLAEFDLPAGLDARAARLATLQRVRALAEDGRVEYAEPNVIWRAQGNPVVTPNDPYYPLQWDMPLMRLPEAWFLTTGSSAVIVAVLDTGEQPHPDLAGRQIAGYDFISSASSAGDGDGIDPDPTDEGDGNGVQPNSFHGTHVSGTIGAASNNNLGVAGVTWATGLMSLRVLGKDGGTSFDIANAIKYAARIANNSGTLPPQRANVINMSLGGPGASSTVQSAVTQARSAGVVLFASAGNENSSTPSYPAAYSGVISVAAVDLNAQRAPYSNFGPTVDLAAPGGDASVDLDNDGYVDGILSTLMDGATPPFSPIYAFYQGTSMACPHAAGVAALMLAVAPTLTPTQIETLLKNTAVDLGAPGRDDLYGYGLVDAYEAVYAAQNGAVSGSPVLGVTPLALSFGKLTTTLSSQVANFGSGLLSLTTLTPSAAWLSATAVPSSSSTSDTASVAVSVDRSGLADGDYNGTITVASNGGTEVIAVSMTVDVASLPVDINLYVLLLDHTSFNTLGQVIVNPTTGLDYTLPDLPAGDYYLVCGSDDDGDGSIFGAGDLYEGIYPSMSDPVVVHLGAHQTLGAIDFPVTHVSALAPPPGPGYRLLYR